MKQNKGELLKTWKRKGFNLKLFYRGTENLGYKFKHKGKLLFEGIDYRPSPMFSIDSLQSVYGLLGFLAMKPGQVDDDYFKNYIKEQLEFAEDFGDELSLMVSDFDEKTNGKYD